MRKANNNKLISVLIFIFSLFMIAAGVFITIKQSYYGKNGIKTEAVITKIEREYSGYGDDNETMNVYVEFYVDGVKYSGKLDTYIFSMKEGKKVKIYYLEDDPSDFTYAEDKFLLPLVFFITGALSLCVAMIFPVSAIKKKKLNAFKKTASTTIARITDVNYNDKIMFMGKHKLKITCEDGFGKEYKASGYVVNGNNAFVGKEITVYLGENDKYKIDVEEACTPNGKATDASYEEYIKADEADVFDDFNKNA